jgi:TolB-like protein/DNA-binding winged helix-turn-helix (wHTH) protein/Tfp pilus assembly protein PilF
MPLQAANYRFGPYELRTRTREIYKHGKKLKLRPQPFQVLKALVERAGDVVTREELRDLLWAKETFVDFEHGLNTSIGELRNVLNDTASDPGYIETLPKLGYRIMVPVEVEASPERAVSAAVESVPVASNAGEWPAVERRKREDKPRTEWKRWMLVAAIAVVAVAAIGFGVKWMRAREAARNRAQAVNERVMLAVLPFENLTGDAGQDYFSDGMTEEMIAQLGRLDPQHLGVIARTSVVHYKHGQEQLDQIGRELGVQYLLEGSVRRDSDKVRISAQLIQVKDQTHVWARQYDRKLINLLALQGEIAQEIANGIQLTIGDPKRIDSAHQASLSPEAYEAYDLYLKGLYFWNKRTVQGFQQAIEYFQQAVAKDPNSARAYAGLADSYALMGGYSLAPQNEFMPKARAAAQRAVKLDDRLAEAHTSLALVTENYDWDWQNAGKEFRWAIQLDPNYATAHQWYAEYLAYQGRFDEALAEIERARQLDPLSLIIATDTGAILYFSRQYDRAIKQFRAVLDMEPNFPRAHLLVFAYVQKGLFADALADIEKWRRIDDAPGILAIEAYVYGRSGQRVEARRALEKLQQLNRRRQMDPAANVLAYVGMDKKDEAFAWLQRAYLEHSNALTALKVDPIYDPLRSDPRFQELLRRVGLPQ